MFKKKAGGGDDYYPIFDWLRAACAIVVMLRHDGAFPWSESGNFAVQIFFALSGWLIGGILLRLDLKDLPRFYFNRAVRIWAPYYLALLIFLAMSIAREPITSKWLEIVLYKILFVYNIFGTPQLAEWVAAMPQKGTFSHVWSVNAEEQFYLLAPAILVLAAAWKGRSIFVWVILAACAWYFEIYASIVFGVLMAVIGNKYSDWQLSKVAIFVFLAILLISAIGLAKYPDNYFEFAPFAAVAIVMLLARKGRQEMIGSIAGGMSYPLYLNHWMGVYIWNYFMPGQHGFLRVVLAAISSVAIATMLYLFYDKKLLEKRSGWFSIKRGFATITIAYFVVIIGIIYGLIETTAFGGIF